MRLSREGSSERRVIMCLYHTRQPQRGAHADQVLKAFVSPACVAISFSAPSMSGALG
jgi:hypothetical protein